MGFGFKLPKGFKIGGQLGNIFEGAGNILKKGGAGVDAIAGEIDGEAGQKRKKEASAKKRREAAARASAAKATAESELEAKRKPLRLQGQRSTQKSAGSVDLFGTSGGTQKKLLGG